MAWPGAVQEELEIAMASVSNGATQTSRIDTRGADYAIVRVLFDTWVQASADTTTVQLLHSDDTVVTNFATIVANETHTPAAVATLLSYRVDLRGKKRYLRVVTTPNSGTDDAITAGMSYSLGRLDECPGSTTDMVVNKIADGSSALCGTGCIHKSNLLMHQHF